MDVSVEKRKGACLLVLSGEIDRSNLDRLATALSDCLASSSAAVVMDLGNVTFIDGSGLGLIHDTLDILPEAGWLGVARPAADILRILALAGLSDRSGFHVFSSLEEALAAPDAG
jgi:anti-anti-sigma factor